MNNSIDFKEEILKGAPPVGVSALSICGVSMADWVYVLTAIYLMLQIGSLLYRTYKHCRK